MAQQVHPNGYRVGLNKNWKSKAYVDKANYANVLLEDLKIREYVEKKLKSAGVVSVVIERDMSKTLVNISVARPGIVIGRGGEGIEKLKKELNRMAKSKIEVKLFEVKKPETSAKLIGEAIANQVERRIVPKFAAQREIEKAKSAGGIKGIRVWVSGRIKGAEIARTEKFQWGNLPLQTLRADIDYDFSYCQVPNAGIHGIKVWVYKGDKKL